MIKIRIRYRRWGSMKYLGHLDLMRYFQRAIRRAGIDICYSEGFSPHQKMSFAAPLGVGITSDGEYFDIAVNSTFSTGEALERLHRVMVDGIDVTGYVRLPDDAKKAMSLVAAADYELTQKDSGLRKDAGEWQRLLDENFLSLAAFPVTKKTEKSEKTLDLRQLVYEIRPLEREGNSVFFLKVCTGSNDNLKPQLALASILHACGLECDENSFFIHRLETYGRKEEKLVPLLEFGEVIGDGEEAVYNEKNAARNPDAAQAAAGETGNE